MLTSDVLHGHARRQRRRFESLHHTARDANMHPTLHMHVSR